jgi:hypothetical protein
MKGTNLAKVLRALGLVAVASSACARAPHNLENDPVAVAGVRAELRLVGSETTWVTRGSGYELVGRSKADLLVLPSQMDREYAMLRRLFPADTIPTLVVTVRRLVPAGKPFVSAAPVPPGTHSTVVEVVLPDPNAKRKDPEKGSAAAILGIGLLAERTPSLPVVRAWLSAHASAATGAPARASEASGEFEDPRIPAWAQEVVPSLTADSLVDRFVKLLAPRRDELIPIPAYFAMERPSAEPTIALSGGSGDPRGGGVGGGYPGGGGMGGGMGGRGGMGGMGGRGGMGGGGRGGTRGGTSSRGQADVPRGPQGSALYDAQSVLVGRYLSARLGYDVVGEMIDAHLFKRPLDEVLARHHAIALSQMDLDWFQWFSDRAAALER